MGFILWSERLEPQSWCGSQGLLPTGHFRVKFFHPRAGPCQAQAPVTVSASKWDRAAVTHHWVSLWDRGPADRVGLSWGAHWGQNSCFPSGPEPWGAMGRCLFLSVRFAMGRCGDNSAGTGSPEKLRPDTWISGASLAGQLRPLSRSQDSCLSTAFSGGVSGAKGMALVAWKGLGTFLEYRRTHSASRWM